MKTRGLRAALANRLRREQIYSRPDYWDGKAREYSGRAVSMWGNNHLNELYHREQMRQLEDLLPDVLGRVLLDLGCGSGRLSRHFAELGARVVGVDFSADTIALARSQSSGPNPEYRVQSVFDLADEAAYDLVISLGTLVVACRDRGALLDAVRRLRAALKPGGRLLFLEPVHRGPLHRVLNLSLREFLDVLREAGLDPSRIRHLHFWPARVLLAYWTWPRWFTRLVHNMGNLVLVRLLRRRRGGDYHAILTAPK